VISDLAKLQKSNPDVNRRFVGNWWVSNILVQYLGADELDALAATMLYRHLGHQLKFKAMTMITNLKNKRLVSRLRALAIDTTYVNPQWGIWSLTKEELLVDQAAHK
jgi:hypothetical protein